MLSDLEAQSNDRYICPYEVATVHFSLGDTAKTLEWLERGYDEHADCLPWAFADPKLEGLHGDPQFESLLERIGLPH